MPVDFISRATRLRILEAARSARREELLPELFEEVRVLYNAAHAGPRHNVRQRAMRKRLADAGLCVDCRRKRESASPLRCGACQEKQRAAKRRREQREKEGDVTIAVAAVHRQWVEKPLAPPIRQAGLDEPKEGTPPDP